MKLSFPSPPEQKLQPAPKILTYLDKRVLIALVYGLFVVVQALSLWRQDADYTRILINFLFFGSAFYYYYQRRHQLKFPSQPWAQGLGAISLSLVVFKLLTLRLGELNGFWLITTPIVIISIILLASGFYGFRHYWKLIIISFFLFWGVYVKGRWLGETDSWLTVFSAKVSSYFLWYLGFNPSTEGSLVYVNDGIIDIYDGCTLTPLLFISIDLLVILYAFYPMSRKRRDIIFAFSLALVLSFVLSIIRLAIMALVVNDAPKFDYWHGPQGSNLFMTICLVGCGLYVISRMPAKNEEIAPINQPLPLLANPEWIVKGFLLVISVVLSFLVFLADGGGKRLASFQFPEQIPLPDWHIVYSEPLSTKELGFFLELKAEEPITNLPQQVKQTQIEQQGSNIFMSGRRYDLKQNEINVQMMLAYVLNSNARFPDLDGTHFGEVIHEQGLRKPDVSYPYLLIDDVSKTHLVSCLTASGKGIVTQYDLTRANRIRHRLFNLQGFYKWMTGQRLVQDNRCLWVHLSDESVDDPGTNQRLVGLWQELQSYWTKAFPPL